MPPQSLRSQKTTKELTKMNLTDWLINKANKINRENNVKILFPESNIDKRVSKAIDIIKSKGICNPITLESKGYTDVIAKAGILLSRGKVDAAILGATFSSSHTIKLAFDFKDKHVKRVSGSFSMIDPKTNKLLVFADAAVQPQPTKEQVAEIALLTVKTFSLLQKQKPRIAMLSYSTYGSGKGDEPEKMREATLIARRLLKKNKIDAIVDGEIQLDSAIIKEIALRKAREKNVKPLIKGDANILIFPNLSAANISYKILEHLGGWYAIGPILQGLKKPINDLSRGCSIQDIVLLAAFTTLQVNALRSK